MRNGQGRLRPYDQERQAFLSDEWVENHRAQLAATMEDLTQKSSMSLTQENPESAYHQFDIQRHLNDQYQHSTSGVPLGDDDDEEEPMTAKATAPDSLPRQYASVQTESTAHTYGENDTGHITLNFHPEPAIPEMNEHESQDGSYAAPPIEQHGRSYEPQTPAPPVNPFSQKGSVMKGFEMFGATQPSSISRHNASPTSSRPSPDVYNDFTSPVKKRLMSSPLGRLPEADQTSPLQSSVRNLLADSALMYSPQTTVPRTPGVQSFDAGPRNQRSSSIREPRTYVSMKESQERRRKEMSSLPQNSDSDGSDSDIEPVPKKRKRNDPEIQRQLSSVRTRMPPSSRPSSATSAVVEVPSTSTSRRRNIEENYLAQCDGLDTLDTQQDDIVADSQNNVSQDEPVHSACAAGSSTDEQLDNGKSNGDLARRSESPQLPSMNNERVKDQDRDKIQEQDEQAEKRSSNESFQEPSLPLKEVSSNRNLRTPMSSKNHLSDGPDATVPETSPPEDRLRPMGEIASVSGVDGEDEIMKDLPGFTQDVEFYEAIRGSSQIDLPSILPFHRPPTPTSINPATAVTPVPSIPHQPPSSSLSPPPPTAQVVSDEADVPAIDKEGHDNKISGPGFQYDKHSELPIESLATTDNLRKEGEGDKRKDEGHNLEDSGTEAEKARTHDNLNYPGESKKIDEVDVIGDVHGETKEVSHLEQSPPPTARRGGLRSKNELKGPSQALRRSGTAATPQTSDMPRQSAPARASKLTSAPKPSASRSSRCLATTSNVSATPRSTPQVDPSPAIKLTSKQSSTRKSTTTAKEHTSETASAKRTSKRKSEVVLLELDEEPTLPKRSSKRQSTGYSTKESSEDPLTLPSTSAVSRGKKVRGGLFSQMAFAVSYVNNEQEKNNVTRFILDHGGQILQEGFDCLFDVTSKSRAHDEEEDPNLALCTTAKSIGFTALIADEHSRRAKYMQALALGLPCISGRWISSCVAKGSVVDWSPYLLCAGQSSFLGNAHRSRNLQPYSAIDASLGDTFNGRDKLLDGKSVLIVMGKGKADKRKAYVFLTRALGPARLGHVVDLSEARKRLCEAEAKGEHWDLLYVDSHEEAAESVVFESTETSSGGGSRKRNRGSTAAAEDTRPPPTRIRVISDEIMVQSLILGQLIEP
jgi:hypothetical protein